jgi:ABC-type multidrug transport system fused ATPase/permease subunit
MWVSFVTGRIRASRVLHRDLVCHVLRLPGSFFDTTPLGRILNRFSSDLIQIDERITWKLSDSLAQATTILASLAVISVTMPLFLATLPPFLVAFYVLLVYYLHASRDGKRIFQVGAFFFFFFLCVSEFNQ